MVAKSYQTWHVIGQPYTVGTRQYIKVRNPSGDIQQVRFYDEEEFKYLYGEKALQKAQSTQKDIFGFKNGYITIVKGDSYPFKAFLKSEGAQYNKLWGWYFASDAELPQLAASLEYVRLDWDVVGQENGFLKAESVIKAEVAKLVHEPTESKFVGNIGERIESYLTLKRAIPLNSYYGEIIFLFEDDDKNIFLWKTQPREIEVGQRIKLRGTIKRHNIYNDVPQTILSYCKIIPEN